MSVTTTVTGALNDLLARLSSQQEWVSKERLARAGKSFAAKLSAISRADSQIEQDDGGDTAGSVSRGTLAVISGRHRGARIELSGGRYLIGSGEDCQVVLRDGGIAERHCLVTLGRNGFSVQDVRGQEAQPMAALRVTQADQSIQSEYEIGGVLVSLTQLLPEQESSVADELPGKPDPAKWQAPAAAIVTVILAVSALLGVQRAAEPASAEQIAALVVAGSEALAERGFVSVRFRANGRGGLEVIGFVSDLAEERRLRQWLKRESYSGVRVSVRQVPQLLDDVRQVLRDDALHVSLHGRSLRIEGTTHQPPLKDRIRRLSAELRGWVEVDDRVVYTPDSLTPGPLPIRLRGVMLDEPRYLVTDSGARYFVGGTLPDGAEVVSIATDGIRFQKDGRILFYSLE